MQSIPDNLPPLMQQAIRASQANDSATALSLFEQASQEEPGSPLPHFLMGAELAQLGKMAEAEAAYARAVILAPEFAIARFELALDIIDVTNIDALTAAIEEPVDDGRVRIVAF